jgi:hypothetical protein
MQREGSTLFKLWIWDASGQVKLILSRMRLYGTNLVQIKWMLNYLKPFCGSIYLNNHNRGSHECVFLITFLIKLFFYYYSGKLYFLKNTLCGLRWASKIRVVPDSYKRCTSWLELETYCADLKSFAITLRLLRTFLLSFVSYILINFFFFP